jgi:hypothetical protein
LSAGWITLSSMLRRFVYLDSKALNAYTTALEGGLLTESTWRVTSTGEGAAHFDAKLVGASGGRSRESEDAKTLADTAEARFDRLLKAAAQEPETVGWIEVLQPDVDFDAAYIGAMVSWECDIFVPEIVQTLARSGEFVDALGMMQKMLPAARSLGLETDDDLPNETEMSAMSELLGTLNASLIAVGDDEDTDWKVAGHIDEAFLFGELDGRARVVGKVSRVLKEGQWRPFTTFPGMNLGSREQRRKLERQRPKEGEEDQYLIGPALMLDILAIYR